MSLNKATLIGRLGRDPETRRTQAGAAVVSFSVATSESWRDKATGERKERTEWHNVVVFNENLAKVAEQFLKKGAQVYLEGKIAHRKYTDKEGVQRVATEIVLEQFRGTIVLLERSERSAPEPDSYGSTSTRDAAPAPMSTRQAIDDDIPF